MKGAGKIILSISCVTFLLLGYVHGQVALFNLSYKIDKKTETLAEKAESYRHLNFEVNQLKAPGLLERKMAELSMDLTLPKDVQVVRVPARPQIPTAVIEQATVPTASDRILNFLGRWVSVAQAKTDA